MSSKYEGTEWWRDPARIPKVMALFQELWQQESELRFGQLVSILIDFDTTEKLNRQLWEMEESEWVTAIKKRLKQTK